MIKSQLPILFITVLFAIGCHEKTINPSQTDQGITLKSSCPPGFELTEDGVCKLRSLYQQYESLEGEGVGGLKTALPKVRDGFTPQQIDLGRYLFFDPILSKDGTVSCAKCHDPKQGLADGLKQSIGILGEPVARSAPSLYNVAFLKSFFWDGRASSLEEQMQGPLFAEDEMGNTRENLLQTLNKSSTYLNLFGEVFPDSEDKIELDEVYLALTAFESSLISLNSRYDQYAHGYHEALTKDEIEGMNVFRSFVARCAECHTPPLFTNQQIAVLGIPEEEGKPLDPGAQVPQNDPSVRGGFKIPSLRNVVKTAPYMHAGQFETLREAIHFYTKGRGHAVPEDENLYLHWHIWEPELSDTELDRLVDFLGTLTDESFVPKRPKTLPSNLD
ncbi:MAG: cytochrome c peroxidase [Granulosicoccus sp.]|jgi:cytochrome c peroxidase